ncbi:MAG: helix-turn-helix domain-containing protein [Azoarcus sp.]|jgi:prophage antirepressor-like protein|nr:helix-turn-helix domain-containing protein [Azoarcus sp.]
MTHLIPAEFLGTQLSIIDHDSARWLTAEQIGGALGFAQPNARTGIIRLYNRHEDEFTGSDTCVVKLTTHQSDGIEKQREVRIFSATGCILLSFFAGTKRAIAFRAWAKEHLASHLLCAEEVPALVRKLEHDRDAAIDSQQAMVKEAASLKDELLRIYRRLDTAQRGQIRALTGQARLMTELGNIKDAKIADVKYVPPEEIRQAVIQMADEGFSHADIAARTGRTRNHIRQILFKHRHAAQGELPLPAGGVQGELPMPAGGA